LVESKEEQLTCKLCKLTFPTTSRMEQHCAMGHKYPCSEDSCDLIFVSKFKLEEHAADVHSLNLDPDKNHVCGQCGQCFSRPENLKKHEERPHEFQCEHCFKKFIAQDRLEKHCIKEHKVLGEHAVDNSVADIRDTMVCPMCDKNFRQLHILRKHKEIEHKFMCTACDKKFTMKHWLKEHMKVVHDLEDELKPSLKCENCDNIFTDNYGYRKHLKIEHTYECNFCNKRFTMKKFLNSHQFYIHNLIAPGMKIPTQDQKDEAIIKAFKEEMKELKRDIKVEDEFYSMESDMRHENKLDDQVVIKTEPNGDLQDGQNCNGQGANFYAKLEEKPKAKPRKPPPPLIKIENIPSESESEEEETESPFVNDVVHVTDLQQENNIEMESEDEDDTDEEEDENDEELVSVEPQYESGDESEDENEFLEPLIQIEEGRDSS